MSTTRGTDSTGAEQPLPAAQISVQEVSPTPACLTLLVNFGIVTGRTPSRVEIEALWDAIRLDVSGAIISVEHRYEFRGSAAEVCLDQVRIEVPDETALRDELSRVAPRVLEAARCWVAECVESLQGAMTLSERLARQAVVSDA
ncbi:MAG: hypothetical protein QOF12_1690 [Solirubrobacteraceae bacterium]|nr:hypothetical protein [Solirubrobacteraceae bacterium]